MNVPCPNTPQNPIRTRTILVADDDCAIRTLLVDLLRQQHATVIAAADGAEALVVAGRSEAAIDLLVTDFDMPKLNGLQLAAGMRKLFPGIEVILMSGSDGGWSETAAFLKKPFSAVALLEKVAAALSSGS
jgi:CheY-like chemotaxis protein